MISTRLLAGAIAVLFVGVGQAQVSTYSTNAATAPGVPAENVGDAQRGRTLFVQNGCYGCHGYDGQGGSYTAPRIAPDPLPWEAIAAFIRSPRGLVAPYLAWPFDVMPAFTSRMVSDRDVQDIYAYLRTRPGPTDLKNVPTFQRRP